MKLPTRISMADVKNHKWVLKFKEITNSNAFTSVVAKIIVTLVFWAIALIPTWAYLIVRWIADPTGFWQELAIVVIFMVVIGWLQVILGIGAAVLTVAIVVDDNI